MRLSGQEMEYLKEAIIDAFPDPNGLWIRLRELDKPIHEFRVESPYVYQVVSVIVYAQSNNWLPTLINAVREVNPENEWLARLAPSIEPILDIADADPYAACYLWGAVPFANRSGFRECLRLLKRGERVVLVVNGDPKSGKSHSYQLVAYAAERDRAYKPVLVDLTSTTLPAREPVDIANAILWAIDPTIESPPAPRNARELGNLCRQMAGHLSRNDDPVWVVFDGLSQTRIPDLTRQMVNWMIYEVQNSSIPNLRLILLGYTDPIVGTNRIEHEQIANLALTELKALLHEAVERRKLAADDTTISTHAETISSELARDRSKGLTPLSAALQSVLESLEPEGKCHHAE